MRWLDKTNDRYMRTISKEEDIEIGMMRRVYLEKMTPEDAVIDIVKCNGGLISVEESINAWNRVLSRNMKSKITSFSMIILMLMFIILLLI